jgi:predicted nucleic acid-binding protein
VKRISLHPPRPDAFAQSRAEHAATLYVCADDAFDPRKQQLALDLVRDALIVQTASAARCSVLYSEDMQAGARIADVLIVNPFT